MSNMRSLFSSGCKKERGESWQGAELKALRALGLKVVADCVEKF